MLFKNKKTNFLFASLFLLSLTFFVSAGETKKIQWKVVNRSSEIKFYSYLIGFENQNFGVAVGEHGDTFYTNDGGKNWSYIKAPVACRYGLEIVNEKIALSTGNGGIAITEDSANTWKQKDVTRWDLISFIDSKNGWVASLINNKIFFTDNGGESFTEISLNENIKNIVAINLYSKDSGIVLTKEGALFFTKDNGERWENKKIKINQKLELHPVTRTAIRFTTDQKGIIFTRTSGKNSKWVCIKTSDGGKSWSYTLFDGEIGNIYLSRNGSFLTLTNAKLPIYATLYKIEW